MTGNPGGPFSLSTKKSIEHLTRLNVLCCVEGHVCAFPGAAIGAWTTEGRAGLWGGEQWPGDHSSEQGLTAGDWTFRFWGGDFSRRGIGNYFSKKVGVVGTLPARQCDLRPLCPTAPPAWAVSRTKDLDEEKNSGACLGEAWA